MASENHFSLAVLTLFYLTCEALSVISVIQINFTYLLTYSGGQFLRGFFCYIFFVLNLAGVSVEICFITKKSCSSCSLTNHKHITHKHITHKHTQRPNSSQTKNECFKAKQHLSKSLMTRCLFIYFLSLDWLKHYITVWILPICHLKDATVSLKDNCVTASVYDDTAPARCLVTVMSRGAASHASHLRNFRRRFTVFCFYFITKFMSVNQSSHCTVCHGVSKQFMVFRRPYLSGITVTRISVYVPASCSRKGKSLTSSV